MRKQNKIIPTLFILVSVILSCEKDDPASPDDNLETDTAQLPLIELVRVVNTLAKSMGTFDVDFDTVFATKSLNYMVVNNGTVDAFNVTFSSKAVITTPKVINSLPVSEGGELGLLPILTITMPHGLPPSGIGPPLPIERGIISDSLIVHYQYLGESADTLTGSKSFTVQGVKVADVIEVEINGISVEQHPKFILYLDTPGTPFYNISF